MSSTAGETSLNTSKSPDAVEGNQEGESDTTSLATKTSGSDKSKERVNLQRGRWPVPQIIVDFLGSRTAWGRETLMSIGYKKTKELFVDTFCPQVPNLYKYSMRLWFAANINLIATFHFTHGDGDEGCVMLQPIGWAELISNVTMIKLELTEEFPDIENLEQALKGY